MITELRKVMCWIFSYYSHTQSKNKQRPKYEVGISWNKTHHVSKSLYQTVEYSQKSTPLQEKWIMCHNVVWTIVYFLFTQRYYFNIDLTKNLMLTSVAAKMIGLTNSVNGGSSPFASSPPVLTMSSITTNACRIPKTYKGNYNVYQIKQWNLEKGQLNCDWSNSSRTFKIFKRTEKRFVFIAAFVPVTAKWLLSMSDVITTFFTDISFSKPRKLFVLKNFLPFLLC